MLKMTWFSVVYVVILGFISLVRCIDEIEFPNNGRRTDDGFNKRNRRQEFVESPSSTRDGEVRLLEKIPTAVFVGNSDQNCSGILITERIVIIAAGCVASNLTVNIVAKETLSNIQTSHLLDLLDHVNDELRFNVIQTVKHPKYSNRNKTYDIAVIKIDKPVKIQSNILPSCLWLDDEMRNINTFVPYWNTRGSGYSVL
uniref:Peptidase S1 domain-containing protein n=1 Tax=Anopheles funestus TaxID=62324 RepID=A0A4Y0BMS7_ANOFN